MITHVVKSAKGRFMSSAYRGVAYSTLRNAIFFSNPEDAVSVMSPGDVVCKVYVALNNVIPNCYTVRDIINKCYISRCQHKCGILGDAKVYPSMNKARKMVAINEDVVGVTVKLA